MQGYQRSYASEIDASTRAGKQTLRKYYDLLSPIYNGAAPPTTDMVIAFNTNIRSAYLADFPRKLQALLLSLGITDLALLDFNRLDILNDFRFENYYKRNQFRRLGGSANASAAYLFKTDNLPDILPLFLFARVWDVPVIFFAAAHTDKPLLLHLCDDGNLHIDLLKTDEERFIKLAEEHGFATGDFTLCSQYSVCYHDRSTT